MNKVPFSWKKRRNVEGAKSLPESKSKVVIKYDRGPSINDVGNGEGGRGQKLVKIADK